MSRAKERGGSSIFEQSSIDYLRSLGEIVEQISTISRECLDRGTNGQSVPTLETALIDVGNQLSGLHADGLALFRKLCELRQERAGLSRERVRAIRQQRIDAGLCCRCGKHQALPDVLHCLDCKKAGHQYQSHYRRKHSSGNAARRRFAAIQ